ncbi:MAG: hypothetical protein D6770_11285 [Anaerolineae bacterium]|nr:MAG: hypothetical protein D6770_11285 [Anaerolineae bacterium]
MSTSLRRIVKERSGQDVSRCQACLDCDVAVPDGEQDIPLGSLVQMVLYNDEEVLTCRTLWSDEVLRQARYACQRGLNIQAIMLALREEACKRGVMELQDERKR